MKDKNKKEIIKKLRELRSIANNLDNGATQHEIISAIKMANTLIEKQLKYIMMDMTDLKKEKLQDEKEIFEGIITLISNTKIKGWFLEKDTCYQEVDNNIIYYKDKIISVQVLSE